MGPRHDDKRDKERASDGAADPSAAEDANRIIGPLTDDELRAGGLDRVVAFIRDEPSKEAIRQRRRRKKQRKKGKRQMNVTVPDNKRSRDTMRATAAAIGDEVTHRAVETILMDEPVRPLIIDIAAQPLLRKLVRLLADQWASELPKLEKLLLLDPPALELIERAVATVRTRRTVEVVLDNPASVLLGVKLLTGRSLCIRVVRRLLRLRRRPPSVVEGRVGTNKASGKRG